MLTEDQYLKYTQKNSKTDSSKQMTQLKNVKMNYGDNQRVPNRKCKNSSEIPQNMFIIPTFRVNLTPVRMASIRKQLAVNLSLERHGRGPKEDK